MSERESRAGRNEAIFREVNEAIEEASRQRTDEPVEFLCECFDEYCAARVTLTHSEYEAAHSVADRFVVWPEHVMPDIERLVAERSGYWIVEKIGEAEEAAEETEAAVDENG